MNLSNKTTQGAVAIGIAALAAAGAAFAAGHVHGSKAAAASGLSTGSFVSSQAGGGTRADHGPGNGPSDELTVAANYLGVTVANLQTSLQSGKTLAQLADATSGKSKAGLIDALVAAEKTEIAAAVTGGQLTQAQADQITATLTQRFTDLVNGVRPDHGPGGPGGHDGHGPGGGDELTAAASYLGLTAANLQTALESGKTLGQIADATSGKSKAGLVAALVAAEKTELAAAVTAGRLTQAQADQLTTGLTQRFTDLVNGVFTGHDHGHGFGGPPPTAPSGSQFRSSSSGGTHI